MSSSDSLEAQISKTPSKVLKLLILVSLLSTVLSCYAPLDAVIAPTPHHAHHAKTALFLIRTTSVSNVKETANHAPPQNWTPALLASMVST
jgi:hypothetical protein